MIFNGTLAVVNAVLSYCFWDTDPHIAGFGVCTVMWCVVDFLKAASESRR